MSVTKLKCLRYRYLLCVVFLSKNFLHEIREILKRKEIECQVTIFNQVFDNIPENGTDKGRDR